MFESKVWGPETSVADIFDAVEAALHDAELVPQVAIIALLNSIDPIPFWQVESPLAHLELWLRAIF